jgi:hypothetical protein
MNHIYMMLLPEFQKNPRLPTYFIAAWILLLGLVYIGFVLLIRCCRCKSVVKEKNMLDELSESLKETAAKVDKLANDVRVQEETVSGMTDTYVRGWMSGLAKQSSNKRQKSHSPIFNLPDLQPPPPPQQQLEEEK